MYTELVKIIKNAENIVFFGGAGVSTESGIPDFRGTGGLYTTKSKWKLSPEEMLQANVIRSHPEEFFEFYKNSMIYPDARPNPAHYFLARLEEAGKLSAVITQNIDGLHQMAGSKKVIELHGSAQRNYCMSCGKTYGLDKILNSTGVPTCDSCGGTVRPDVVMYGEGLDGFAIAEAEDAVECCDVLIVAGTSLSVYPAAGFVADYRGEHLIIINQTPTRYDGLSEMLIRQPVGEVFEAIDGLVFQ